MRLIDVDELIKAFEERLHIEQGGDGTKERYAYMAWLRSLNAVKDAPTIDAVEVVRCKDCKWYDPPHIEYNDGSREDYPTRFVTIDEGCNVGGKCINERGIYCCNHDREDPEDQQEVVTFRMLQDYCSYAERRED